MLDETSDQENSTNKMDSLFKSTYKTATPTTLFFFSFSL